jgi:Family of unknown function (DUF6152)
MKYVPFLPPLFIGLAVTPLAMAHHSFQADYDQPKPLVLVGKLTRVITENPHGWIYLAVKTESGKTVNWQLETPGPGILNRNGFTRDIFESIVMSGEDVTVTAYPARDESKHGWAGGLTRADGRTVIPISGIPNQGGRGRGFVAPQLGPGQQP